MRARHHILPPSPLGRPRGKASRSLARPAVPLLTLKLFVAIRLASSSSGTEPTSSSGLLRVAHVSTPTRLVKVSKVIPLLESKHTFGRSVHTSALEPLEATK